MRLNIHQINLKKALEYTCYKVSLLDYKLMIEKSLSYVR